MLLGSPPDMVHGFPLRRAISHAETLVSNCPGVGIHPCESGLQAEGTANSPTSATLL